MESTEIIAVGHGVAVAMSFGSTETAFSSVSDATGVMRWHASILLGCMLARTRACSGMTIVELGCGASLPSAVASVTGATNVIVTDAFPAALELGYRNVCRNAPASCAVGQALLEWQDEVAAAALPRASIILSSENLYVYRSETPAGSPDSCASEVSALSKQATSLFRCAIRLLAPDGIMLGVYSPRYRGMAARIAEGASNAGMTLIRIDSDAVLTPELRISLRFGRTRLFVAAPSRATARAFLERHGLSEGPDVQHESDSDEDADAIGGQSLISSSLMDD